LLRKKFTLIIFLSLLFSFNYISTSSFSHDVVVAASDYERTYTIHDEDGHSRSFSISIPRETYQYYVGQSHSRYVYNDLKKFVTSEMFTEIADSLSDICSDDYSFINAVLEIAQQIPYEEHEEEFYPIETLVNNKGDCSDKSFIVASFLTAKGYYTVLLIFSMENPQRVRTSHLVVGVAASIFKVDYTAYYIQYEGKKYYYCEVSNKGWRIGELPPDMEGENAVIIEVGGYRQATISMYDYEDNEEHYPDDDESEPETPSISGFPYEAISVSLIFSILTLWFCKRKYTQSNTGSDIRN